MDVTARSIQTPGVTRSNVEAALLLFAAILAPAASTFIAWWLLLGFDSDDKYTVLQCAALVLVLMAIGSAAAWLAHPRQRFVVMLSAGLGISAGCFTAWMDDETGMFVVGWMMLTPCALLGSALVVSCTGRVVDHFRGRSA
jgi:hypothetical protein